MKQETKNVSYYVSLLLIPAMDGLRCVIRPRVNLASVTIVRCPHSYSYVTLQFICQKYIMNNFIKPKPSKAKS